MANKLVKLRPISGATNTPDAGTASAQKISITINGMTDGAGVAVIGDSVYMTDYDNHVIYRYRNGDTHSNIFAGAYGTSGLTDGQAGAARFNKPAALAVDLRGNLWVVDSGNARVRRIDENANVYTVAAIAAEAGGDFVGGIAVDASGNIYYIDSTP